MDGLLEARARFLARQRRNALVDELLGSARRGLVESGDLDGPDVVGDVVDVALAEPAFVEDVVGFVGSIAGELLEGDT